VDRGLYISKFRAHLLHADDFLTKKESEYEWRVESKDCRISFIFERFDEDCFVILVSNPKSNAPGANFFVLRYIRAARDLLPDAGSPENQAEVFNTYFGDILRGDFSILKEQERRGKEYYSYLRQALSLDDNDPIKNKIKNFDITWLDDLMARK
jgi:hypothetical protein